MSPILEKNAVTRAQILLTDKADGKLNSEVTSFQFDLNLSHNSNSFDQFLSKTFQIADSLTCCVNKIAHCLKNATP